MNEFEMGDVLVEIGKPTKWVVWLTDSYSYHLKPCDQLWDNAFVSRKTLVKDVVNSGFVKVGRWRWEKWEEFDPIDN